MVFYDPLAAIFTVTNPIWLIAATGAVIPVVLAFRTGRKSWLVLLECLAVLLVAFALADPSVRLPAQQQRTVLILTDASGSVRKQDAPIAPLPENTQVDQVYFAANLSRRAADVNPDRTLINAPLEMAIAQAHDAAGVVIQTDGQFTDSDWQAAAQRLGNTDAALWIQPFTAVQRDARVTEFQAERQADGTVRLSVSVTSNARMPRRLSIERTSPQPQSLLSRELSLLKGQPATFTLADSKAGAGMASYRAYLHPSDSYPENDQRNAVVHPTQTRVAIVAAPSSQAGLWAERSIKKSDLLAPEMIPTGKDQWFAYSSVVVLDSTGQLLSTGQRQSLAEYVRTGGGLVLIGAGPHDKASDVDDPLNKVSALLPTPYVRSPLAVTVVLDASGSMSQRSQYQGRQRLKFDLAIDAVLDLKRHLTGGDTLRIITFSEAPKQIYDSGDGPADFALLHQRLREVNPSGGTKVLEALQRAASNPAAGERKQLVILLSDLMAEPFSPTDAATDFKDSNTELSIIAIGRGESQASDLENLADILSARLERRENLLGLAEIFADFVQKSRGQVWEARRVSPGPEGAMFNARNLAGKRLAAVLPCAAAESTRVVLQADGDPLLGVRQVGLGRSVMLAADPTALQADAGWQGLIARATEWTNAGLGDPRFTGQLKQDPRGKTRLTIEAQDQAGPMNLLQLTATVLSAGQEPPEPQSVILKQISPGTYQANLPAASQEVAIQVHHAGRTVWRGTWTASQQKEFSRLGPNWENLQTLASLTGGEILTDQTQPLPLNHRPTRVRIWWVLALLALAVMLLDWLLWHRQKTTA